jgi:hypothetical protein
MYTPGTHKNSVIQVFVSLIFYLYTCTLNIPKVAVAVRDGLSSRLRRIITWGSVAPQGRFLRLLVWFLSQNILLKIPLSHYFTTQRISPLFEREITLHPVWYR